MNVHQPALEINQRSNNMDRKDVKAFVVALLKCCGYYEMSLKERSLFLPALDYVLGMLIYDEEWAGVNGDE